MLLDISRPVSTRSEPWPGDPPLTWRLVTALGQPGSRTNTAALACNTHLGSHVDAPWHFRADGATVDRLPLEDFLGPARVIDARGARGLVEPSEGLLRQLDGCQRALFRTRERTDPYAFERDFAGLSPGLAEELARRRLRLVGTDAPSVDAWGAEALPSHHALGRAGCQILEWLDLGRATPGDYELLALPLRLEGLDASPVRAVLRR